MTTYQKKQITEEEVMFYDIDPVLDGDTFRVQPTPTAFWAEYSFSEFAGWLQDTGRVDVADNDAEYISADGCGYSYRQFWRHICHSHEADTLIRQYTIAQNTAAKDAWIAEVREPQPCGPEVPGSTWQEHAEGEANELPPFSSRGWAEFVNHTENR